MRIDAKNAQRQSELLSLGDRVIAATRRDLGLNVIGDARVKRAASCTMDDECSKPTRPSIWAGKRTLQELRQVGRAPANSPQPFWSEAELPRFVHVLLPPPPSRMF